MMNPTARKLFPFLLAFAVLFPTTAQARKVPGQVIDNNGNIEEVTFKIPFGFLGAGPEFAKLQTRVVYYDKANQKHVLKADKAREINFVHRGIKYRMLSCINADFSSLFYSGNRIFMHLETDGRLKLLHLYTKSTSPGMSTPGGGMTPGVTTTRDQYYLQIDDGVLFHPRGIAFRKDMAKYLQDCPEVAKLIEEKELRRSDLIGIVRLYNKKCGDESPLF